MVEISEKKIEVENDVVEVKGTLESVTTMKEKIVNFGKKHKRVLIAVVAAPIGAAIAIGIGAAAGLGNSKSLAGEDNDFEDASSDAECDVF